MKSKQKVGLGLLVSGIATITLLILLNLFGSHVSDTVGFGVLIGFSYAALYK
ncbi:hypothetical protein [Tumebacillus algifaecis]|uniref:hypothetical protein n=1 Tax=Tumebacillus algifaecis TaxID=1214604 RepID=UPI0012FDDEC7|nr:hypothetical protein [Tumebacillus algifaecis]